MKYFYVVDHYVPFPSSEYGGIWNVIAENDEECFDLIVSEDTGNFYEQYYTDLKENILNSSRFLLSNEIEENSKVIESFIT
jgi:hypothetical protein